VVSGHKQPDGADSPDDIAATIGYFTDLAEVEGSTSTALEFYREMLRRQPDRANVGSLWGAAKLIAGEPA
jgi:hypothetical protein